MSHMLRKILKFGKYASSAELQDRQVPLKQKIGKIASTEDSEVP